IEGDIRYMSTESQKVIEKEMKRIVKGIEAGFGVECILEYNADYPPLYNHPEYTEMVAETLKNANDKDIKEVKEYPALSPSEDFAYYLEKIPGSYFFIGCTPKGVENPYFNHHPKFDIDEDAILVAAKAV